MKSLLLVLVLLLGACSASPTATPTPLPPTTEPVIAPATATRSAPADATPAAQSMLTPALLDVTLPRLAEQTFTAGEIKTTRVLTETDAFTTSLITYTSDGIEVTGLLNVPRGAGPFPAVVLVHGYVPPSQYIRGLDAQGPAEDLAANGYITLVPDLRGYEESGRGMNLFLAGFIADAINAGQALRLDPRVDKEHIGIWGHSMGGGVANRVMVVSDVFAAVVLYAPISANMEDMFMDPFGGEPQGVTEELVQSVITALDTPGFRMQISPINYLKQTSAPVSIHVGTADKVTPQEWSRAIRDGLKQANKQVEYFDYQGQGHSFTGSAVPEFYNRVLTFFDKHLK